MSRPQVVKRIWAYVRQNNLQDPSNKRIFICDDKMEAIFKRKRVECFAMNKLLSLHLSAMEEIVDYRDDDDEPVAVTKKSSSVKRKSHKTAVFQIPDHLQQLICPPSANNLYNLSEILHLSLQSVRNANLFKSNDPTTIIVDDAIRAALDIPDDAESISVVNYLEMVRGNFG